MDRGLNRRDALRQLGAGAIGAAASTVWVHRLSALARIQAPRQHGAASAKAAAAWTPKVLNARQNDIVVTLTELIIPQTETPGAEAALVNRFIDTVLQEAQPADRDAFLRGLAWLDPRSTALFGKDFLVASREEQVDLLTKLSAVETTEDPIGIDFFQAIKSMTVAGYYTSEIGLKQELGDDGQLFLLQFAGCDHPEHQG